MNKKVLLVSALLSTSLFASSIDFKEVNRIDSRVLPTKSNQILSFNQILETPMKAVVNISTKKRVEQTQNMPFEQMLNDPLFRRFFGDQFGKQFKENRIQRALGSGVILSEDGYIVTNNHVIQNADEITVTLSNDKTEYNAKVIGTDEGSDLAVIKIEAKNLKPIKVGHSTDLKVGDMIFAIGNPFGIGETVTQGIISALDKNKVGINRYENFIQTDASINPGNSGGALVDSRGALIGINSAIISKSGGNNGIGFAIPVSMMKDVVKKLVEDGKVTRGYLGVVIEDLNKELKNVYNHKNGALILDVAKDTPAYKYGLKRGDLIYAINNKKIKDRPALQHAIAKYKPNEKVTLYIERNKKDIQIDIVLGDRDKTLKSLQNKKVLGGLNLSEITATNSKQFRIPSNSIGVLINNVEPKSNAEKVGFQAGDVIIQIEDIEVKNLTNVKQAIDTYKNNYKRVYINRYGQVIMFVIK
jgi:serine protease Do